MKKIGMVAGSIGVALLLLIGMYPDSAFADKVFVPLVIALGIFVAADIYEETRKK